jgi:hypothetical protein
VGTVVRLAVELQVKALKLGALPFA